MALWTTPVASGSCPSLWPGRQVDVSRTRVISGLLLVLGLGLVSILLLIWSTPPAGAETWFVAHDGSGNYLNLTAALADTDYVQAGDVLSLAPGTYNETLVLNFTISIIGQGEPGEVVIDGGGAGTTIHITANDTMLANLTVRGSQLEWPYAAVHVHHAEDVQLAHLNLTESHTGLYLEGTQRTSISNLMSHKNYHGVWLLQANETRLEHSIFRDNTLYGLVLQGARDTHFLELSGSGQVLDLRLSGVPSHDIAYNCTFDTMVFVDGPGSLRRVNFLTVRIVDDQDHPLEGVELNLSVPGESLYRTPAFGGDDPVSDDLGAFDPWMVTYANITAGDQGLTGPVSLELSTPADWRPQRSLNLSSPLALTLTQPDQPPRLLELSPANGSLQRANLTLSWTGLDPDGAELNFTVWSRIDDGLWVKTELGNLTEFDMTDLPVGSKITWKVEADDGNLTANSSEHTFTTNGPATVRLLSPVDGQRLSLGPPILNWTATDNDSTTLTYSVFYGEEDSAMVRVVQGLDRTYYLLDQINEGGNYTWRVEVDDGLGPVSSAVGRFVLNQAPEAHIETTDTLFLWPANLSLAGHGTDDSSIVGHQWQLTGVGVVANVSAFILDNLTWGSHIIEYRVLDEEGLWSDRAQIIVKLYTLPVAEAGANEEGKVGRTIFFDPSGSSDLDGEIVLWEWDFDGDGNYDWAAASPLITHTYHQAGPYQAVLRVTDNDGYTAIDAKVITVVGNEGGTVNGDDDDKGFLPGPGAGMALMVLGLFALGFKIRSRSY